MSVTPQIFLNLPPFFIVMFRWLDSSSSCNWRSSDCKLCDVFLKVFYKLGTLSETSSTKLTIPKSFYWLRYKLLVLNGHLTNIFVFCEIQTRNYQAYQSGRQPLDHTGGFRRTHRFRLQFPEMKSDRAHLYDQRVGSS